MLNSYLDFNFEVIGETDTSRYGDGNDISLVNFGREKRRREELTDKENKRKISSSNYAQRFAERQEKATYGLNCNLKKKQELKTISLCIKPWH